MIFWNLVKRQGIYLQRRNNAHKHIEYFNPDVTLLENIYHDFHCKIDAFHAGKGFEAFDEFITQDAYEYNLEGNGVTYIVWNVFYDKDGHEYKRDIVGYYTLSATAIPYEDRIRRDEDEAKEYGSEFDIEICGISALEIKMFAVSEQYQNIFFKHDDEDLPIAAWIIRNIINFSSTLSQSVVGFKALFLHSVPEAESFYLINGFHPIEVNMQPFHSVDSDYKAMYLALKNIQMNYDD